MNIKKAGSVASFAAAMGLALSGAAWAHAGHDSGESKGGKEVSMKGEIVDLACYSAHEGKGPKHAECAKECVLGGAPIGLLAENGSVYLLLENHATPKDKKPYAEARTKVAETVTISGDLYKRGGLPAIVVESVTAGK